MPPCPRTVCTSWRKDVCSILCFQCLFLGHGSGKNKKISSSSHGANISAIFSPYSLSRITSGLSICSHFCIVRQSRLYLISIPMRLISGRDCAYREKKFPIPVPISKCIGRSAHRIDRHSPRCDVICWVSARIRSCVPTFSM